MAAPSSDTCRTRLVSRALYLPGEPVVLSDIGMSGEMREKLKGTGQEFTFRSDEDSTAMSLAAARAALERSGLEARDIGLVITAPTLTTSYGLEIPAIAIRTGLGLMRAECLNVAQGCVGFLASLRLANQFLLTEKNIKNVLIVTACKASTMMDDMNHGSFFWGDAAAATVVTSAPGTGLKFCAYKEISSEQDWGAMRVKHGDHQSPDACDPAKDLKVVVDFAEGRAQMDYIVGEQARCEGLIAGLLDAGGLTAEGLGALFLPSIGANRIPHLLSTDKRLRAKVKTDFRYAHMGGVDALFSLDLYLNSDPPAEPAFFIAATPAYTAQWGGVLLRYEP